MEITGGPKVVHSRLHVGADGSHLRPHRLSRQVVDDIPTDHEIGDGFRGREQRQYHYQTLAQYHLSAAYERASP